MVRTRHVKRKEVTYSSAKKAKANMLIAIEDDVHTYKQFSTTCGAIQLYWRNLLRITSVLMRFPILHRVGEYFRPGNADEKIRCEAGTYTWLNENCPSMPTPKLYGFALSTGQTFTAAENLSWLPRYFHYIRCRILNLFGRPVPSKYVRHQGPCFDILNAGYLLIEYIDQCRVQRIGSFVIDDNGFLVLNNRPLSVEIPELEGKQIPVDIPRDIIYSSVDSYVTDILAFHDSRFAQQPNALKDSTDGAFKAAALTTMRAVSSYFFKRALRWGPFIYVLNDLHQSNILVDEEWNIISLIDLEYACSRPIEMLHPPYWFTSPHMNTIDVDHYTAAHREFMTLMEQQEEELYADTSVSSIVKNGLGNGSFWYSLALQSPTGLEDIFYDHIETIFTQDNDPYFIKVTYKFWKSDMDAFIASKVKDKAAYDTRLQEEFHIGSDTNDSPIIDLAECSTVGMPHPDQIVSDSVRHYPWRHIPN
ncbi:hypothetical protein AJ78_03741 [Emergomyces pasteurianus Ep9510]|uniref:Aminoglycoside phosphotransferase domain-containing protein n=1 Tax=Emergomyces pasteurianus Ep9510 TaxID=1447872 RepID=A0A1J9QJJ7_9EURO|nr:hypothetical protein AJ78_03741 [Emergomyces pasteurianus Ep9510]